MAQFYSRVALAVAIYAVLFAILLIATRHFTEPEGVPFVLLVIGFPWVLACVLFPKLPFFVAVVLNTTTFTPLHSPLTEFSRKLNQLLINAVTGQ
jgi:hypothetical protein